MTQKPWIMCDDCKQSGVVGETSQPFYVVKVYNVADQGKPGFAGGCPDVFRADVCGSCLLNRHGIRPRPVGG